MFKIEGKNINSKASAFRSGDADFYASRDTRDNERPNNETTGGTKLPDYSRKHVPLGDETGIVLKASLFLQIGNKTLNLLCAARIEPDGKVKLETGLENMRDLPYAEYRVKKDQS